VGRGEESDMKEEGGSEVSKRKMRDGRKSER
jgi:hypothetical protein